MTNKCHLSMRIKHGLTAMCLSLTMVKVKMDKELHAFSLLSYLERLSIPLMQLLIWLSFETFMKIRKIHQSMPPRFSKRFERQIVRYYIVARCSVSEDSTEKGGKSEEGNSTAVSMIQSSLYDCNFSRVSTKSNERGKMQISVVVLASGG
ncbi:uncharacterized protein LOC141616824 [Silene latifolia]|uniref:uncharacterized protein LOC141616824 n=1 Tax=Silene latifolia TaxID=37657 RepID=UPI003D77A02E